MFGSGPRREIAKQNRPDVAIVFSESTAGSSESKNLAHYLCGQLANSGYANTFMIGINGEGGPADIAPSRRIVFSPTGYDAGNKKKQVEIPASDVTFAYLDKIATANVIIITVNSHDMPPIKQQLVDILDPKRQNALRSQTIFTIQRGVKNAAVVKDQFIGRKDVAVVEGVVGFAVVPHPKTGAYCPTVRLPCIIYERLSKEIEDVASGPLRLMENLDMQPSFDKTLTPYSWGVLVWENLYALNTVSGGTLSETLLLPESDARLLLAAMTRECRNALSVAARGGGWRASFTLVSSTGAVNPWLLEMLLVLPMPLALFHLAAWCLGILPPLGIMSPGQLDLSEGRKTMCQTHLGELVQTGQRHSVAMPVCALVLARISAMEAGVAQCLPGAGQGSMLELKKLRDEAAAASGDKKKLAARSLSECYFWLLRLVAVLSLLPMLFFLLLHEYG